MNRVELPSAEGLSVVWSSAAETGASFGGVQLILGSNANAAAAVEGSLPVFVSHVVCVAEPRLATQLEQKAAIHGKGVVVEGFPMSDFMPPDATVSFDEELRPALQALQARMSEPAKSRNGKSRAVLVSCKLGHNRSPALVLGFLVTRGMTLREAYRQVLAVRPTVDPLPPYRRALQALELKIKGSNSITGNEPFAMHLSELLPLFEGDPACNLDYVLKLRELSIQALVSGEDTLAATELVGRALEETKRTKIMSMSSAETEQDPLSDG